MKSDSAYTAILLLKHNLGLVFTIFTQLLVFFLLTKELTNGLEWFALLPFVIFPLSLVFCSATYKEAFWRAAAVTIVVPVLVLLVLLVLSLYEAIFNGKALFNSFMMSLYTTAATFLVILPLVLPALATGFGLRWAIAKFVKSKVR